MAQQPSSAQRSASELGLLARVGDVEALDAIDARRPRKRSIVASTSPAVRDVPERMRPHRDAAGVVDRVDRLRDRSASSRGRNAGLALDQVGLEERRGLSQTPRASRCALAGCPTTAWARWGRPIDLPCSVTLASARARRARTRARAARSAIRSARCSRSRPELDPAVRRRARSCTVDHVAEDVQVVAARCRWTRSRPPGRASAPLRRAVSMASGTPSTAVVIRQCEKLDAGRGRQAYDLGGASAPSECREWLWRSNVGSPWAKRRSVVDARRPRIGGVRARAGHRRPLSRWTRPRSSPALFPG